MQLSFRPPLGTHLHIHAPPCSAPARLLFTAAFASHEQYEEYKRGGARLELWANPDSNDLWASQTFSEWQQSPPGSTPPTPCLEFSLNVADDPEGFPEHTLAVWLCARNDAFEYTFRLVYPSGEVSWLGNAHNNGKVFIDRSNPAVVLHHAWSVKENDPGALSWQAPLTCADDVEMARLAVDIARSSVIWALEDGRFKRVVCTGFGDPALPLARGCSLIIVVPRLHTKTTSVPPVMAFSAAPGSSLSISSHGEFTASGPGKRSMLLQTYDGSNPGAFLDSLLSHSHLSPVAFSLLGCDAQEGTIVLASSKNMQPISILTLSMLPSLFTLAKVNIKIHELSKMASNPPRLVLFSNTSYRASVVDDISKCSPEAVLNLTTDPAGGLLTVAAVHTLGLENALWDIAVLSPHLPVVASDHALPTPPASPTLRPIAHLSLQHSVTSSSTSISSVKDVDQTALAGLSTSESTQPVPTPSSIATRWSLQQSLTMLVRRNLYFVLGLWRLLFSMIFSPFFWLSAIRGRFASARVAARSDKKPESGGKGGHSDMSSSPAQSTKVSDIPRSHITGADAESIAFMADLLGVGDALMLLQRRSAGARIADVVVEYDGVAIKELAVEEMGEGRYLLSFERGVPGGRLKISLR